MIKNGFLRFCDDPELACCRAERELGQLREKNVQLRSQLQDAERRAAAAVEDLTAALTCDGELIICEYCKNNIICKGKDCEHFEHGEGATDQDGKYIDDFKWTCEDIEYGSCAMMEHTPCNGCFASDYKGFEWRDMEGEDIPTLGGEIVQHALRELEGEERENDTY